ncbi:VRR-NUC domain-containing protein [Serratia nevei]|uniref:VRR-NUC domain-containing protein n=1 Tax=Serratia TaxID=613 RepID=UPI0027E5BA30|nr:VRR-NUC domain-containing protein [Serratia nevei]MDQ7767815.1 VRR-NUC domain-containing protein [Serratia nevei]
MKLILRLYHELHSRIERHLVAQVKAAGGTAYKLTSSGRRNVPDRLVLLLGGRVVFVECKAPSAQPQLDQVREHNRLRALGCEVVILDSKNLEGRL